jgi:hypothetical protein
VEHDNFNGWTSSTLNEAGCYTDLSDMHQIGVLMRTWEAKAGEVLVNSAAHLMEYLLSKRLSAHDAALHPWFSAHAK